jgi:chemotaxis protein histidine kinase CheA
MSLDDLQAQLRDALDQQFAALKQQYESGILDARRQAAQEAEREATARLAQMRTEMEAQIEARVQAARAESYQQAQETAAAERQQLEQHLRQEFEQQLNASLAAVRTEAEQGALESLAQQIEARERELRAEFDRQLQQTIDAAKARAKQDLIAVLDSSRKDLDATIASTRQALEGARERARQEIESVREHLRQEIETVRAQSAAELEAERARASAELDEERGRAAILLEAERSQAAEEVQAAQARASAEIATLMRRLESEIGEARRQSEEAALAAAQARAEADARATHAEAEAEARAAEARAVAEARAAERAAQPSVPVAFERAPEAVRDLDATRSLTQALDTLLAQSAAVTGRAAIFLINGDRLQAWKGSGIPDVDVRSVESLITGRDLLSQAIQAGQAIRSSEELPAPPFARLGVDRMAVAAPVMIGGRAVAVLYADGGVEAVPPGAMETVEVLARHASTVVALRTATRTLDVLRGVSHETPNGDADGDEQGARRFAKLLISEIKLYNEAAVRDGRQQRDLRQRLRAEIDRAQRLYEERVPPTVTSRHAYFQQELVQTLADGDPALLGSL